MPTDFQKLLKKKAASSGSKKRKEADPPSKGSSDKGLSDHQVGKQPEKKSKRIRTQIPPSSSAATITEPSTEEQLVELIGEARHSSPSLPKNKEKEVGPAETLVVSIASESADLPVQRPTLTGQGVCFEVSRGNLFVARSFDSSY